MTDDKAKGSIASRIMQPQVESTHTKTRLTCKAFLDLTVL